MSVVRESEEISRVEEILVKEAEHQGLGLSCISIKEIRNKMIYAVACGAKFDDYKRDELYDLARFFDRQGFPESKDFRNYVVEIIVTRELKVIRQSYGKKLPKDAISQIRKSVAFELRLSVNGLFG